MKPGNETIAHNIKFLRERENLTQGEFGEKYGSNQKAVWSYEKGNSRPKPEFLLSVSRGLGLTPEALLTIRLKKDSAGNLSNIPKMDKQVQVLRKELKELTAAFEKNVTAFIKGIGAINQRIDLLEKGSKRVRK